MVLLPISPGVSLLDFHGSKGLETDSSQLLALFGGQRDDDHHGEGLSLLGLRPLGPRNGSRGSLFGFDFLFFFLNQARNGSANAQNTADVQRKGGSPKMGLGFEI